MVPVVTTQAQDYPPYGYEPEPTPEMKPTEMSRRIVALENMDDALLYVLIEHGRDIRSIEDYLERCLGCGEALPEVRGIT